MQGLLGLGKKRGPPGAYAFMYSAFRVFGRRWDKQRHDVRTISFSAKLMRHPLFAAWTWLDHYASGAEAYR